MAAIFTMKTMLFIGVSMNDPEMKLMLGHMYDAFNGSGPRHYAFVSREQFSSTEIGRWLKDYKIKCMPYTPNDKTHPELDEFLIELKSLI